MPLLRNLEAQFYRYETRDDHAYHVRVDALAEAQGVRFLCPKCFVANGGSRGTHSVVCWQGSKGVPPEALPNPGRWKMDGTGLDDLTLNADPPFSSSRSVLLTGPGCGWHGFVTNGVAE